MELNFKTYTGTKTIKAVPMDVKHAKGAGANVPNRYFEIDNASYDPSAEGYLVIYADGYRSWSPKKAFEDAYRVSETHVDRMKIELADLTSQAEREADKMLRDPKVKRHVKKFVDACAEGGVESVTMTATDGKTVQSATIEIPKKGNKPKPNDNG